MSQQNLKKLIAFALTEDRVFNDKTSDLCLAKNSRTSFVIKTRESIIFCGKEIILEVFKQLKKSKKFKNSKLKIEFFGDDCDNFKAGEIIAQGQGCAKLIFAGERIILNFIQHLSGISTATNHFVNKLNNSRISILDTRKTFPAYRSLQKYAVICGGGKNHRFDLSSQILIKDNHLASSKKNIASLINISKKKYKNLQTEIECDDYWQVLEALESKPDIIMLDNMDRKNLEKSIIAIRKKNSKIIIEVSGGINLENISNYRDLDIDCISIGSVTHSVKAVDIGLDINNAILNLK
jgi:nicotinate-nucleotide pyrophosphorylase (carboxylating)